MKYILNTFVATGWAGVFFLFGFLAAGYFLDWKFDHARIEAEIEALDQKKALICEARGTRMECLFVRVEDETI